MVIFAQPSCFDVQYAPRELQLELVDLLSSINLKVDFKEVGVISLYKHFLRIYYLVILKDARRMANSICEYFYTVAVLGRGIRGKSPEFRNLGTCPSKSPEFRNLGTCPSPMMLGIDCPGAGPGLNYNTSV